MNLKTIYDIKDLAGKRILMRVDFNVPLEAGKVGEDYRLRKIFPTINYLRDAKAKIILISHIENVKDNSLRPVFDYLSYHFPVTFLTEPIDEVKSKLALQKEGEVVLLENLRKNPGEKENDDVFAAKLASFGDLYVNEAFPVSHRAHASIVGVPKFIPAYAGIRFVQEIKELSKSFTPPKPFLFIIGGAKFETKMPLIKRFLDSADHVFIGGALANDCFKAKGWPVGNSVVSNSSLDLTPIINHPKVILPKDVVVEKGKELIEKKPSEVAEGEKILDAGPESLNDLRLLIQKSLFVLWNGPLGNFEAGFKEATLELAQIIANTETTSVIGGGDTVGAISELRLEQKFSFISTGGGAMLEYLANGTLPGIQALENSK
ncbi:MAG TPA: phosphoglycerate kinase [Candidatus Paceibacterota bacterium]